MRASSSRFAPMSSARTPARVGFGEVLVGLSLARIHCFRTRQRGGLSTCVPDPNDPTRMTPDLIYRDLHITGTCTPMNQRW